MRLFRIFQNKNNKEIEIGDQVWMTKNLNVYKFNNGEIIPQAKTISEWQRALNNKQPACCYRNFDSANGKKYGMLYNWFAVNDARGIAPNGWHIPNKDELETLIHYLGGEYVAGAKLKSTIGWKEEGNGTNESGFSALPGGSGGDIGTDYSGAATKIVFFQSNIGSWWSSSEHKILCNKAYYLSISFDNSCTGVFRGDKCYGHSVRCVRGNNTKLSRNYINKNLELRLQIVRNANSTKIKQREGLLTISENDSDYKIRKEAFQKLGLSDSQKALFDITVYDDDRDTRIDACKRIKDQGILAEIVIKHYSIAKEINDYVGYDLISNITDQLLLLKITIEASDLNARSKAVKKITDMNVIRQLISNSDSDQRGRIVPLIKDQTWLKELALDDDSISVQIAAINKIEDQSFLLNLVRKRKLHESVKETAILKIKSYKILADLYNFEKTENIRATIIDNIDDNNILFDILSYEQIMWLQCKIASKITDENIILKLLKYKDEKIRAAVIKNIINIELLIHILKNDTSEDVRKEVVKNKNMVDQDILEQIALRDEYSQVRLATIEKLKVQSVINHMALYDKDMDVQRVAIDRVIEEQILLEIYDNHRNHFSVRKGAFSRCLNLGFHGHSWDDLQ